MAAAPRVAVVGGGVAGSLAALALRRHGADPVIFDMGKRSLGGRLGTLRPSGARADTGAQFIRSMEDGSHFSQVLRFLEQNRLIAEWKGRFGVLGSKGGGFLPKEIIDGSVLGAIRRGDGEPDAGASDGDFCGFLAGGSKGVLYTGLPSMAHLCEGIRALGEVEVQQGVRVTDVRLREGLWTVVGEDATSTWDGFHAAVLASHNPALAAGVVRALEPEVSSESIAERLRGLSGSLQQLRDAHAEPVFTLTAAYPEASLSGALPFDAVACPTSRALRLIVREASKPGRAGPAAGDEGQELWTAVSTAAFAREQLRNGGGDAAAEPLERQLAAVLKPVLDKAGVSMPVPLRLSAKRWGAGFTAQTLGLKEGCIGLEPWRLAIAGDFISSHNSPLEAAMMSGLEAGDRVAAWLSATPAPQ